MNTAVNNKANKNTSVAKGKMSVFRRLMNRGKPEGETGGGAAFGAFSEHYIMTDTVLGTGTYAEVRKARKKGTNEVVAVKIIDKKGLNPRELRGLQKEVNILKSLRHRNVVKFYDSFEQEDTMYVVMEFVAGGELFTKIVSDENGYTEKDVQKIIRTLGEALKHCKDRGVIHRDIKPQNLLLTSPEEGGELKLADFNLSIQLDPEAVSFSVLQTMCGTPNYVAPEILSQKPYDYKCDIWSLGVICYLLLSGGYLPFFVEEEGEVGKDLLLQKVRRGRWSFYPEEAWVNVSPEAKDFLLHVMERVPEKRYDYETLLAHQWLRGTDEKRYSERINVDSVQFSLYKRKLQCATTVYAAVDLFRQIMEEKDKIKDIAVGMQSGEEGFENLLDA